jgi:hypothetical protein
VVVKVSAAPYLLLLDLYGLVEPDASRATVQGSALTVTLRKVGGSRVKAGPGPWAGSKRRRGRRALVQSG